MIGVHDMAVHPKVITQHMTGDPFHHAPFQPGIDHPGQRDIKRRVVHHLFNPGPKAEDGLGAGERREILNRAGRGEDNVIHLIWRNVDGKGHLQPGGAAGVLQGMFKLGPAGRATGVKDVQHKLPRFVDMATLDQPEADHQYQHRRAPIADQRQGHPDHRGQPHDHRHIDRKEQEERCRDPKGQK